jgi:hypothetical protein
VIVRVAGDRLQLITQPDHARLARRIMEHCVPLASASRRRAILHAIEEHDNGWREEDAAPCIDPRTGEIADFITAPVRVRQGVWPRGVARLASDPWAAALVAQHAITIYDRNRSDPEWTPFFAEMQNRRDELLHATGLPLDDLLSDYVFVRLADLISLTFCAGWTDAEGFGGWTVQPSSTRIAVAPKAFDGDVPFEIDAREIRNRPFQSDEDLREAVRTAETETLTGVVGVP